MINLSTSFFNYCSTFVGFPSFRDADQLVEISFIGLVCLQFLKTFYSSQKQ